MFIPSIGSGKTYTMFGPDISDHPNSITSPQKMLLYNNKENEGIIIRACKEILHACELREKYGIHAEVYISFVEIFGTSITDLLRNGEACGHSRVASHQYVLSGASEMKIHNIHDIVAYLIKGDQQKRKAATAMNERSTRAHSIFILTLKQTKVDSNLKIVSKLFLADLGGSEQVKKSQVGAGESKKIIVPLDATMGMRTGTGAAADSISTSQQEQLQQHVEFSVGFELGTQMREAVNINLGLLALKKCIEALNNKSTYVPFKESKLTMLLSGGLGGNSKTSIIVCGNMHSEHAAETMAALRFGEKCALLEIELKRNNISILNGLLHNIEEEMKLLNQAIKEKEKWEIVTEHRIDVNAEEGTMEAAFAQERKVITVVRGAEAERKRLAYLLEQKEQLTGKLEDDDEETSYGDLKSVRAMDGVYEESKDNSKSSYNVIGFGRSAAMYDLGMNYDISLEEKLENVRFNEEVVDTKVPEVIRRKGKKWSSNVSVSDKTRKKRETANRSKWAYAGWSA